VTYKLIPSSSSRNKTVSGVISGYQNLQITRANHNFNVIHKLQFLLDIVTSAPDLQSFLGSQKSQINKIPPKFPNSSAVCCCKLTFLGYDESFPTLGQKLWKLHEEGSQLDATILAGDQEFKVQF
jgi:hypothetical protein